MTQVVAHSHSSTASGSSQSVELFTGVISSLGNLTLSAAYCLTGLTFVGIGVTTSYFTALKVYEFYTLSPPDSSSTDKTTASASAPPPPNPLSYGFGEVFNKGCLSLAEKTNFMSAQHICEDLSKKCWAQLDTVESKTAAIGLTIFSGITVLYLPSAFILAGLSLLGKSWSRLTAAF